MLKFARSAVLLLGFAALTLAQDAPDPFLAERILPQNALIHLSIPQSAALADDYAKSNLAKLIQDPEVRPFIASFESWWKRRKTQPVQVNGQALPSYNDQARQMLGVSIDELWELLQGPLSFTVYDLPASEQHKLDLVLTLGATNPAALEKAAAGLKKAVQNGRLTEGEYSRAGATIREFGDNAFRLYYTVVQKTLLVSTQQERMNQIVDAAADKNAAGLREDAAFKAARARVAPDNRHFFLFYVNLGQTLKQYRREMGDEALKALEALGLTDVPSVAIALGYDGPFIRERYSLQTTRQDRGLIKIIAGGSPADPYAARVPSDALSYSHFGLNLGEMYDVLQAAAKANPDFEQSLRDVLGKYEQRAGFKVREALASIGTNWTSWSAFPAAGGLWPDSLTAVSLADPAAFESALEKTLRDAGLAIEDLTFRGRRIRCVSVGLESLTGAAPVPLPEFFKLSTTMCYLIEEKTLLLASHPMSLKRQILRGGDPSPSILQSPKYAALSSRLQDADGESRAFMDVGRTGALLYGILEPFAHIARDMARDETGELIVDLAKLPLEERLAELVGSSLTTKRTLPEAIVVEARSNTGASLTSSAGLVGITAAIAIPALLRATSHGGGPGGIAGNEMIAEFGLQVVRNAEETFKNSDSDANGVADFWTRDVAGLHSLKDRSGQAIFLVDPATAAADPEGAARYGLTPAPKNGYFYRMMVSDQDGGAYQKDDGKSNKTRYGVVAWPAVPGATGRFTFITNESGKTWKKDTLGQPVVRWP
ncbi:MAG TPA: DUF2950 family protein, partial [Planctomycetota bacterium]|nr:DUF2950 family protein [Planctomycetota bacterium]